MVAAALALAGCGGGGGNGDQEGVPPSVGASALVVTTAGPPGPIASGWATALGLTVANTGTAASAGLDITSGLDPSLTPTGVTCEASGGAACPDALSLPLHLPGVPAGGSVTFHVALTTSPGLSGVLTGTFHVSSTDLPGGQQDVAADVTVATAAVYIQETAPQAPVPVGGVAVFTTTLTNPGPDIAPDLQLSHQLESTLAIGSVTCQAQGATPCPPVLGASVTIPSLGVGDKLVFTVPVTVQSAPAGRAVDVVRLQRDGQPIDRYNEVVASAATYDSSAPALNSVHFVSDPGERIGGGQTYDYKPVNADISITSNGSAFELLVSADKSWRGEFRLPTTLQQLQPGTYAALSPPDTTNLPTNGSLALIGGEYTCGFSIGDSISTLTIDNVAYAGTTLSAIDFHFDQACSDNPALLHGTVHWTAADVTKPPGPWAGAPSDLWQPPVAATAATANYVYLQSEIGDFVGNGFDTDYDHTFSYTQADAIIDVNESAGHLTLLVTGDAIWNGSFDVMTGQSQIGTGFYPSLLSQPQNDTAVGGFRWGGDGHSCDGSTSWVAVDSVRYTGNELTALDARFEQLCQYSSVPLHGKIHWDKSDPTRPPPPVTPVPAGLWQAAAGATPAQGSYVYLQADPDSAIPADNDQVQSTSTLVVATIGAGGALHVAGGPLSDGDFMAMNSISQLQPGYYPDVTRFPGGNPTKGQLDWTDEGEGCNTIAGWFVIDRIQVVNGTVQSLDLRFEQRCNGQATALHGQVHVGP